MTDDRDQSRAGDALLINALADGELDAASALALEKRLANEPELAARYAAVVALRRTLREKLEPESAPAGLRERVTALAAEEPPRAPAPRRRETSWPRLFVPALAAAMALGVGLDRLWLSAEEPDPRLNSIISAYRRGQIADQPVDVAASDRHVVKPWLARKLPVSTVVVDLATEGFPLVGARIDIVAGQPAPTLVYRRRQHQIALTELPSAPFRARAARSKATRRKSGATATAAMSRSPIYRLPSSLSSPSFSARRRRARGTGGVEVCLEHRGGVVALLERIFAKVDGLLRENSVQRF